MRAAIVAAHSISCTPNGTEDAPVLLKWVLTTIIALLCISGFAALLRRVGLGRLPGDFEIRMGGRKVYLPVTTTLLLSGAMTLIARLF